MRKISLSLIACIVSIAVGFGQAGEYRVGCIGFYNLENLFDTIDTPDIRDTEFSPKGVRLWNTTLYQEKLTNLATVIKDMGTELSPDGPAILGVSEVENRKVLEDLAAHPLIAERNYKIVHFDSPDKRGIDVAMLYQEKYFQVTGAKKIPAIMPDPTGEARPTRDILYVSGLFDGDSLHVLVNHWPSRSGGEAASAWKREYCALLNKQIIDSLQQVDPNAKVLTMGDLNDDPISPSVKDVLRPQAKVSKVKPGDLYNPMYNYFKKGIGTLAWRDSWNLFDQIIMTSGLLNKEDNGYHYFKAKVYNEKYLQTKTGQWKGYPWRTFSGDNYIGGYSDHFPVYVFIVKRL